MEKPDVSNEDRGLDQLWPMGAVTRRTGIGEHTLRAWERRFGFPKPRRLPSGHRRYTSDQVQQLLLVNAALAQGYRAGDVVTLPKDRLEALLRECGALEQQTAAPVRADAWLADVLDATRRLDRSVLYPALHREAATLGVPRFLRERVAPLVQAVGEEWSQGNLDIRHEHFCSEVLEDHLRSLRQPLEASASGRPVVLASLPDEHHALGLHIVALAIAARQRAVRALGPHSPPGEIAAAAVALDAVAVGVSVSAFSAEAATVDMIADLRRRMSERVLLWVGGAGAAELEGLPRGVEVLPTLDDLDVAVGSLETP